MAEFTPANDLEEAMLAASQDPDRYGEFLTALAAADVYIPQPQLETEPVGERVVEEGEELSLPILEHEGGTYVPVYTSLEQFERGVPEGSGYVRLALDGLVDSWPEEHGIALNPGGDLGLALAPGDVRALGGTGAVSSGRLPAGTQVMLAVPEEDPIALLDAVSAWCRDSGKVRHAFRALMALAEDGEEGRGDPQIVIGLEFDEGVDPQEAFADAGRAAGPSAPGPFSFVVVDESDLSPIARFLMLETDPFYRREAH